jgi:hypothetical protein
MVIDQQNAAIPGVEVRLVDVSTNTTMSTSTNDTGRYIFVNVPSGTYNVTFSKTGFTQSRIMGQEAQVGSTLTLNTVMEVGATTTTVEVTASKGADLVTTNASVGSTITGDSILALPNLGRDVSTLAVLQPGVTLGGYTAGAYMDQNTYSIDGGNATDDMAGNTTGYQTNFTGLGGTQTSGVPSGVVPTPVESVEEIRVSSFNQTADFNSSIGSQVQMVTKRGTTQYHGSGYWYYYGTDVGAANTWSNDHTPETTSSGQVLSPYTPLTPNHRNRVGGSLGGPLTPKILGGKTFFFINYEGLRYPDVFNYEHPVPTDTMRAGVIFVPNAAGTYIPYNLNPNPVTVNGVTYQPAVCPGGACDPRGIGINPIVSKIWSYMPEPNDPYYASNGGDGYNVEGYLSSIRAPLTENSYVARVDHDFGDKWRLFASYRYMRLINLTTNQVDIGGLISGDTKGTPTAIAPRPQNPGYMVLGMTTNVTPTTTNEFRFNYTRNFWQWGDANAPPQLPGLGGAVEIASGASNSTAESTTCANTLIPYNVGTQCTRQRVWDGQDKLVRDDLTMIKGNHLFQFGGNYQRNYDYHERTDNGSGINDQIVYQIASTNINFGSNLYYPTTVPTTYQSNYRNLYSEVLGLVSQPQVAYTRSGSNLTLNPVGQPAYDQDVIPFYNMYFSDTWHMKPTFTLTYSMGWALELPPYELNGKQPELVNSDGDIINTASYLADRKSAALAGSTYEPILGYEMIRNVGGSPKYPMSTFYGAFSPRVAASWNPKIDSGLLGKLLGSGKTVLRGGYGRIWGRLNGVNLVLVPLLGLGPLQPVTCAGASMTGQCLGANNVDPSNVFRIGTDGMSAPLPTPSQTLAQPFFPGYNGAATAGDVDTLDPNYRPERTDNFSVSLQRELRTRMMLEIGYIGRIVRNEMEEMNLDAVPYMTTLNNQSFAQAYAAIYNALASGVAPGSIAAQPFLEAALGGKGTYCTGYANCTDAVASKLTSSFKSTAVSDIWAALNKADAWTLGRTMISGAGNGVATLQATSVSLTTSMGFGNYNAMYVTWKASDFHGATVVSNFTWGRALGTAPLAQYNSANTALNPWDMQSNYGTNSFDIKLQYNVGVYYAPPVYRDQRGVLGHVLGGWTISPLFTAQSGSTLQPYYSEGTSCSSDCQSFGESSSGSVTSTADGAVLAAPYTGGSSAHYNNAGAGGVGTNNPQAINMFTNPSAVLAEFRPCVLGMDTSCGGGGIIRGLPTWNLDGSVMKNIGVWKEGKVGATLNFQFTNVLNHMQPGSPSLNMSSPSTFGRITSQSNTPRQMELGIRLHF